MNDDLIKRLNEAANPAQSGGGGGSWERDKALLSEAAATIARQQVMLDRALESNGDMQAQVARLRGLLVEARDALGDGWGTEQVSQEECTAYLELLPRIDAALEVKNG